MSDPLYVAARRALLDALDAIVEHRSSIVLVGAQAVYVHAGESDIAVAPTTTDGDLAIDPQVLSPEPLLEEALESARFVQQPDAVGIWEILMDVSGTMRKVQIDLLVPDSLGGGGRRGARIPKHDKHVARKVVGLEGALVDRDIHVLPSLDPSDERRINVAVAGPGALVVAKVHKIAERVDDADRLREKDALDIYRLLRVVSLDDMVRRLDLLRSSALSRQVTEQAIESLPQLFGSIRTHGTIMLQRAIGPLAGGATPAASLVELVNDLLREL